MNPKTAFEVRTDVRVQHGNVVCEACPSSDVLVVRHVDRLWEIHLPASDVLGALEALGKAYDWRKMKLMEKGPSP